MSDNPFPHNPAHFGPDGMALEQWPADRPRPTEEQLCRAADRLSKEVALDRADGYQGDWGMGLSFTMSTYTPMMWLHLFLEEPEYEVYLAEHEVRRADARQIRAAAPPARGALAYAFSALCDIEGICADGAELPNAEARVARIGEMASATLASMRAQRKASDVSEPVDP